jgi:glycosyltransferase involved in cell wall biosynthesis
VTAATPRAVFVNWFPYHGRSDGIARSLGIRAWFSDGGRGPTAVREIRRWRETTRLLHQERPDAVIVMQPPVIALWCIARYARRNPIRIAGDLHTGVFDEPGNRLAMRHTLRLLRRHGIAIVTNDALAAVADAQRCPVLVLHDLIEAAEPDLTRPVDPILARLHERPYVLVPLAYAYDEPVDELLAAAKSTPDLQWVFTGRPPRSVSSAAPPNVAFPGYVSNDDFSKALSQAAAVVAMTKNENTMQRAAYEALSYGRPLVTAATKVLSDYYGGAAEIVTPRAVDIAAGVRRALADDTASDRMIELRTRRIAEQDRSLARLRNWVESGTLPSPAD